MSISKEADQQNYPFSLPNLPYAKEDLGRHYSLKAFDCHYGVHHQKYVDNLNLILKDNIALHGKSLEEIIKISYADSTMKSIFNNAAQIWNHSFYWHCFSPTGGGVPTGKILNKIEEDFGSFEDFVNAFKAAGTAHFGSGWAFLVLQDGKLKIVTTSNADTPVTTDQIPIFTVDLWEHAYYVDYYYNRAQYLSVFFESIINWNFAEKNLMTN